MAREVYVWTIKGSRRHSVSTYNYRIVTESSDLKEALEVIDSMDWSSGEFKPEGMTGEIAYAKGANVDGK